MPVCLTGSRGLSLAEKGHALRCVSPTGRLHFRVRFDVGKVNESEQASAGARWANLVDS